MHNCNVGRVSCKIKSDDSLSSPFFLLSALLPPLSDLSFRLLHFHTLPFRNPFPSRLNKGSRLPKNRQNLAAKRFGAFQTENHAHTQSPIMTVTLTGFHLNACKKLLNACTNKKPDVRPRSSSAEPPNVATKQRQRFKINLSNIAFVSIEMLIYYCHSRSGVKRFR